MIHPVSRRAIVTGSVALAAGPAGAQSDPIVPVFAPQGRLTLTSGVAVTTADVAGAGTVYYTPAVGRFVPIWDGSRFAPADIGAELSNILANSSVGKAGPAAVEASAAYFLMVWNDAGTIRLTRSPKWGSLTAPGTGLGSADPQLVEGFWTNKYDIANGPAAGLGTIVGGFVSEQVGIGAVDSMQLRYLSNLYNATPRTLRRYDATESWAYSTGAWRTARGNGSNVVAWFHCLGGRMVTLAAMHAAQLDLVGIQAAQTAIGIDSPIPAVGCLWGFDVIPLASRVHSIRRPRARLQCSILSRLLFNVWWLGQAERAEWHQRCARSNWSQYSCRL